MAVMDPETDKIRKENEALKERMEALEAQIDRMSGNGPVVQEPQYTGPLPQYRLIKPFYGPDDVYYDPETGDEVIEWTGPPNDAMEPMNEPAKQRMQAWLERLPGGKTPPLDIVAMAATMVQSKFGAAAKDMSLEAMAAETLKMAKQLQNERSGHAEHEVRMPQKHENVPVMGNDPAAARAKRRSARADMIKSVPQPSKKPNTVIPNVNQSSTFSGA